MTEYQIPTIETLLDQFRNDLRSAHAEICKLQGLDPEIHTWPEWSSPANTLRWLEWLQGRAVITPIGQPTWENPDGPTAA